MVQYRLGSSRLFPNGTRLILSHWGDEKLVLHSDKKVTLELADSSTSSGKPTISASVAGVVDLSEPKKMGSKWTFTVKASGAGQTTLTALDASGGAAKLFVYAGAFKNHSQMGDDGFDLIANIFRTADVARMHAIALVLHNIVDNIFNENSAPNIKKHGTLACGTVSKVGGREIFYPPIDYTYNQYHKTIPPKTEKVNGKDQKVWKLYAREEVTYDEAKIQQGLKAIQQRLKKGVPSVLGLAYAPSSSIQPGGWLKPTGLGGHSVLVVGCNAKRTRFLYFDPFGPDGSGEPHFRGSILKYDGGPSGLNAFPLVCEYLGIFEAKTDPARGGTTVLRQDPNTQAPGGMFDGNQYLEVISGPLN